MDSRKHFGLLTLVLAAILAFYGRPVDACMCMPAHPQTHFAQADYGEFFPLPISGEFNK